MGYMRTIIGRFSLLLSNLDRYIPTNKYTHDPKGENNVQDKTFR